MFDCFPDFLLIMVL